MMKLIKSKKGFEFSMQIVVIAIILLVALGFVLWFFIGRGEWLNAAWGTTVEGGINQADTFAK